MLLMLPGHVLLSMSGLFQCCVAVIDCSEAISHFDCIYQAYCTFTYRAAAAAASCVRLAVAVLLSGT